MSGVTKTRTAYDTALGWLARREYGECELKLRLRQRSYDPDDINKTIASLKHADYLSDNRYTEAMVRHRSGQGYGPRRIRSELLQKGVEESLIQSVLDNAEVDWSQIAMQVLNKKQKTLKTSDPYFKQKCLRHMAYRGFDTACIKL